MENNLFRVSKPAVLGLKEIKYKVSFYILGSKNWMIDTILSKVKAGLDGIKDHRMQSGNLQYTLGDTLMSAFAMFHLKDPLLLVFRQRLDERWSNMERVYKIRSVPRKNLFEKVRQVFDLLPCMAMNVVYRFIAKEITLDFPMLE